MLRQVITVMMGNVDAGKSQIIDTLKRTTIVKSEPGKITQSIKAYSVSLDVINKICSNILKGKSLKIPGILILDTPGHAAFTTLRKRGGSLADISVLVIDINEGIMPQTIECIEILKQEKTPLIIALNKIDLLSGWIKKDESLIKDISLQSESVRQNLDKKLYELVARLYDSKLNAERFDRIDDFTKTIAIIPCSAKTSEGIPELLLTLSGLAQKFLETSLECNVEGPAEGTILEIAEEKGIGKTLDVIIYNGTLKTNDQIVIGSLTKPIVTKVKSMFIPEKEGLKPLKEAHAAIGVKISAHDINEAIAGMPLRAVDNNLNQVIEEIQKQTEETTLEIDNEGIILKADNLGSLEALIKLLKERNIKIKSASIGEITKRDITEASSEYHPLNKIILGFNVKPVTSNIKIITNKIIYRLIEDFEKWHREESKTIEEHELKNIVRPYKLRILPNCIFHKSNPAIVGVEVLAGILKPNTPIMKDKYLTDAKGMQSEGKNVEKAEKGKEVAISLPGITVDRQIKENDILYSDVPEEHFRTLRKLKKYLNDDEIHLLKEIADIKRKANPTWGI